MTDSYPLTKISSTQFIEGYWRPHVTRSNEEDNDSEAYPFPVNSGKEVDKDFLVKLGKIMNIINYDEKTIDTTGKITLSCLQYKGYSFCRLCDNNKNGSSDYILKKGNHRYTFPQGVMHYYKEHHVQPSDEFYELIMSIDLIDS